MKKFMTLLVIVTAFTLTLFAGAPKAQAQMYGRPGWHRQMPTCNMTIILDNGWPVASQNVYCHVQAFRDQRTGRFIRFTYQPEEVWVVDAYNNGYRNGYAQGGYGGGGCPYGTIPFFNQLIGAWQCQPVETGDYGYQNNYGGNYNGRGTMRSEGRESHNHR